MAKTTGPLLSLGASGTIGKTITASIWRGQPYMRQHVIPANPQTTSQNLTRNAFSDASNIWKNAGPLLRSPWSLYATGQKLTDRNAFIGSYVRTLRAELDRALMIFSPSAKGGVALTAMAAAAAAGAIDVTVTTPTPPTGWTIADVIAVAIPNVAPDAGTDFLTVEADNAVAPYNITLPGLTTGQEYVVGAFIAWTKPDTSIAFGASINQLQTPT